ncbi:MULTISPECIES: dihydropteroate synthase [Mameliella]|uniref:dihydropteroate synthase n=1 Tax=Mameliella TaxID=1434019 RepID=UPI0008412204|nr:MULTISPECIES: dihydropteroate synthase [Mameliella]ODM47471.1 dihydropteroate synthase [Ruegeria sp. PBVC088]MBY6121053.1 dihydropteroate synthase [Mameliella alba]MDD9729740.1 dihydropteroate synthase [Mameliella sp. AT18]OWV41973.1 dihydropteroate synthase [Mameliella alba]OWV62255.1 dihydropteroate synthase [Mameliella alba]
MSVYFRPVVRFDSPRPDDALDLAGGPGWFAQAVRYSREAPPRSVSLSEIPEDWRTRLSAPRAAIAGMVLDSPRIMGILNVTPDSFSDGGSHQSAAKAVQRARRMVSMGAHIIDVGGESTRPGALPVPNEAEIARIEPVITALSRELATPISIDTRKSAVADAAVTAGAALVNDVSGFTYDPMLAHYCRDRGLPVCVMHARGDPETMQQDPRYDDVLLDVYDFLAAQVAMLEEMGIPRARIIVDPGIGFGKTIDHNLTLLRDVALFHGLGCPVLVGASRKGFIGKISGVETSAERVSGSVAVAQAVAAQGVQIVRVHDVSATAQALAMWRAISRGSFP